MTAGDVRWFAVHTHPRREHYASDELCRQGYWTFYPFLRKKIYVGRRRFPREVEEPLFSRYIFVAFRGRKHESTRSVNSTFGVSTMVYLGGEPLIIPNRVLDRIMALTDDRFAGNLIDRKRLAEYTEIKQEHWFKGKPGDQVILADEAPFFGLVATLASIEHLDKKDEISIWLKWLGAEREIAVQARAVASVISRDRSKPVPHDADVAGSGRRRRA